MEQPHKILCSNS